MYDVPAGLIENIVDSLVVKIKSGNLIYDDSNYRQIVLDELCVFYPSMSKEVRSELLSDNSKHNLIEFIDQRILFLT